ncbi:MAG TPA: DM13 domain-containing protein [Actinomycetota bacterium]
MAPSRVTGLIARHKKAVAALLVLGIGLAVFVLVWFQPQKLFLDTVVDEADPVAAEESADPSASGEPRNPKPQSRVLAEGEFIPYDHAVRGSAKVIELADGRRVLRFEDFETSNGPDVVVYLSSAPAAVDDDDRFTDDFLDLGAIKGNVGNQNYDLPASADLDRYRSVVIWCRRFTVAFAAAPLDFT